LTWTGDNREIIYSANLGGGPSLWRVAVNGGTPERMSLGVNPSSPVVSRQGDRLAWTENYASNSQLGSGGRYFPFSFLPRRFPAATREASPKNEAGKGKNEEFQLRLRMAEIMPTPTSIVTKAPVLLAMPRRRNSMRRNV
jgi:hypothetical protein